MLTAVFFGNYLRHNRRLRRCHYCRCTSIQLHNARTWWCSPFRHAHTLFVMLYLLVPCSDFAMAAHAPIEPANGHSLAAVPPDMLFTQMAPCVLHDVRALRSTSSAFRVNASGSCCALCKPVVGHRGEAPDRICLWCSSGQCSQPVQRAQEPGCINHCRQARQPEHHQRAARHARHRCPPACGCATAGHPERQSVVLIAHPLWPGLLAPPAVTRRVKPTDCAPWLGPQPCTADRAAATGPRAVRALRGYPG